MRLDAVCDVEGVIGSDSEAKWIGKACACPIAITNRSDAVAREHPDVRLPILAEHLVFREWPEPPRRDDHHRTPDNCDSEYPEPTHDHSTQCAGFCTQSAGRNRARPKGSLWFVCTALVSWYACAQNCTANVMPCGLLIDF